MSDRVLVDARGLSCPEPMMLAKQALKGLDAGNVEVLVDAASSRDNITRMAKASGWAIAVDELPGAEFRLVLTR